ncbi:DUF6153 family protein [Streptomyces sp. NBC_00249]|uniref:DUF6153 family protein n=1 Tax=Streptomyces sp. NBC_00249 TaxID=2975690 RepID=UPI00225A1F61|nr:DUF6153 family protein [Streptomyces sp. NBC_00249]MCX5193282.1 DUF6153 family protein [Streptomyces sp. NBC_00249]
MSIQAGRAAHGPFGLPRRLLLVLAVLTGLLAMHGLGPGAVPVTAAPSHTAASASASADPAGHHSETSAPCACPHDGPGGGHAQHADPTCAAAGISGAPVLPAPAVLPGINGGPSADAHGTAPAATACGRAPPSLTELQLLRI